MVHPNASDKIWGSCVTQVPTVEFEGSVAFADMSHETPGFLSGPFRGTQERRAAVDKKGFAIVSTFKRLSFLLWGEVVIYGDHRNLAYILLRTEGPRPRRRHNIYKDDACFSDSSRTLLRPSLETSTATGTCCRVG